MVEKRKLCYKVDGDGFQTIPTVGDALRECASHKVLRKANLLSSIVFRSVVHLQGREK